MPSPDIESSTIDRDLDLAVFEFAPGAIFAKDKQKHEVTGFSGSLAEPQRREKKVELKGVGLGSILDLCGFVSVMRDRETCGQDSRKWLAVR